MNRQSRAVVVPNCDLANTCFRPHRRLTRLAVIYRIRRQRNFVIHVLFRYFLRDLERFLNFSGVITLTANCHRCRTAVYIIGVGKLKIRTI